VKRSKEEDCAVLACVPAKNSLSSSVEENSNAGGPGCGAGAPASSKDEGRRGGGRIPRDYPYLKGRRGGSLKICPSDHTKITGSKKLAGKLSLIGQLITKPSTLSLLPPPARQNVALQARPDG
jgi:hypothetical protein